MQEMMPIQGLSKAKRIKWGNAQNVISWAFMKELREHNDTRKVYDVNPYVEVYQYRDGVYALYNPNCDGAGDVWMFLIVGEEKAMLIDTAFGLGDSRALVDEISGGKELIVVNTHCHCDHAYGNCRFDQVYCSEYEVPGLEDQNAHMWDYLVDENGKTKWLEFDPKDLPTFRQYEIVGVPDGFTFRLGPDHEVELVWLGGHSGGSAAYLDKKNRIVFPGDNLCSDVSGVASGPRPNAPSPQFMNLTTFRSNLARLVARMDEYDYVFPSHFMLNLENRVLADELKACDEILADPDRYDYLERGVTGKGEYRERRHKYINGLSTLAYTLKGLYPPEE